MIAGTDMEVAGRIRAEGPVVLIAGQDVAREAGIEERPATAAWGVYGPRMRAIHATAPGVIHEAARRLQDGGWPRGVINLADDVRFEAALAELDLVEDVEVILLGASAPGSRLAAIARDLADRMERKGTETTS